MKKRSPLTGSCTPNLSTPMATDYFVRHTNVTHVFLIAQALFFTNHILNKS